MSNSDTVSGVMCLTAEDAAGGWNKEKMGQKVRKGFVQARRRQTTKQAPPIHEPPRRSIEQMVARTVIVFGGWLLVGWLARKVTPKVVCEEQTPQSPSLNNCPGP
jgi:hypothetical protein